MLIKCTMQNLPFLIALTPQTVIYCVGWFNYKPKSINCPSQKFWWKCKDRYCPTLSKQLTLGSWNQKKIKSKDKFELTKLLRLGSPKPSVSLSWPPSDDDCCSGGGGGGIMVACLILRLGMTGRFLPLEMARLFITPVPCRRPHSPFSRFVCRLFGIQESAFNSLWISG